MGVTYDSQAAAILEYRLGCCHGDTTMRSSGSYSIKPAVLIPNTKTELVTQVAVSPPGVLVAALRKPQNTLAIACDSLRIIPMEWVWP